MNNVKLCLRFLIFVPAAAVRVAAGVGAFGAELASAGCETVIRGTRKVLDWVDGGME